VLGFQHNAHASLAEFVEYDIIPKDQRFPFSRIDLLSLISRELLLSDKFASHLLAVTRTSLFWQRRHDRGNFLCRQQFTGCHLPQKLFAR
jgi:hypothetical protein